jgi:hypothetical protein
MRYFSLGADGNSLSGFDATEKSRAEFEMLVDLGVRMINTFYTGIRGISEFMNYAPRTGTATSGEMSAGGGKMDFTVPFDGDAVLYLLLSQL